MIDKVARQFTGRETLLSNIEHRGRMRTAHYAVVFLGSLFLMATAACTGNSDRAAKPDTAANALVAPNKRDSVAPSPVTARTDGGAKPGAATAPSVDQQFLRMMSDHHKGLIAIAHATMERKDKLAVKDEARRLDTKQDAELDAMVTMLETQYHDPYAPKVTPDNQAMLDSLTPQSAKAYDRAFRQSVIKHHQDGMAMIDQYLPRLTNAKLRAMAEKMKADQQRDVAELQRKLGTS